MTDQDKEMARAGIHKDDDGDDKEDGDQDRIVPMGNCRFFHADEHAIAALGLPRHTLAEVIILSPYGISLVDAEDAIDWVCCIAKNACDQRIENMPSVAQTNTSEYGARLATLINCNQTEIEGDMITRRMSHFIMSTYNPVINHRPVYGQLFAATRDFLEKPARVKETIRRHCVKYFEEHSYFIKKRPGEEF